MGGACAAAFEPEAERPQWLSDRLLQFAGITRFGDVARPARSSTEWPFGANMAFRASALGSDPFAEELGRNGTTLLSGEESALVERLGAVGWTSGWSHGQSSTTPSRASAAGRATTGAASGGLGTRARRADSRRRPVPARARNADPRPALSPHARSRLPLPVGGDRRLSRRAHAPPKERLVRRTPSISLLATLASFPVALVVRLDQHHSSLLYPDGYQYLPHGAGNRRAFPADDRARTGGDTFVPNADAAVKPLFPLVARWSMPSACRGRRRDARHGDRRGVGGGCCRASRPGSQRIDSLRGWPRARCPREPERCVLDRVLGTGSSRRCAGFQSALALVYRRARLGGVLVGLAVATRPEMCCPPSPPASSRCATTRSR